MEKATRKLGRLISLALALLLALTFAVPVFAADTTNRTITIHNNEGLPEMKADQFKVYQLFTGIPERDGGPKTGSEEWNAKEWNNWTLADVEWGKSVEGDGSKLLSALKKLSTDDAPWLGETNPFADATDAAGIAAALQDQNNAFMQGFAKWLLDGGYLTALDPSVVNGEAKNDPADPAKDTLTYTVPTTGYYLFAEDPTAHTGDAVSEYIIAVMGDQDILLKASVPTVDKDIVTPTGDRKGDAAGISDYVQFKLTGTLPKNYADFETYKYIFHDTLSKGLTYVTEDPTHKLTVRVYDNKAAMEGDTGLTGGTPLTVDTDYTVVTPGTEETEPKCNLEVTFANLKAIKEATLTADSYIVVTYYAKVNQDAVIGSDGNPNQVILEYSNNPNSESTGKTKEKKVAVYSFALDLTKIGSDKADGLPDAGFVLSKKDGKDTYYATFEDVKDGDGDTVTTRRLTGWVKQGTGTDGTVDVKALLDAYKTAKQALKNAQGDDVATAQATLNSAKEVLASYLLESKEEGKIPTASGLDAGAYTLTEAITPDGYNTMDDVQFTITATAQTTPEEEGAEPEAQLVDLKVTKDTGTADFTTTPPNKDSGTVYGTLTNQKAPFLPFTGGIGTLIFYVLGIALIGGAVTYLVIASKKRKKSEENA